MVDADALSRLVGDVAGFLGTHWGRTPLHVAAGAAPAGAAELLTLTDVDHLVATTGLRAPEFRLVERGRTLPQASVTRQVRIGSKPVSDLADTRAVHRAVADGATLVLQGLHRSFAPITTFCRDLERTLTHPVQANAYLTPPIAQGLNLHADPHDVFAVQTHGTKRWVVEPPDGSEAWDLQLVPGDVLYLPAGVRHAAQTHGQPSLHLTLGVRTVTWRSVVQRAVDDLLGVDDALDASLPAAWADEPELLADELSAHLERVAARLAAPDGASALDRAAARFFSSRTPDFTGGLVDLLDLDQIDDRTPLRRREGVDAEVQEATDGRLDLVLADRTVRMPGALGPVLRRCLTVGPLRPAELEELMDPQSRLVLCRRLVREGVLAIERGSDGDVALTGG